MPDDKRPMVSYPLPSDPNRTCSVCGRPWNIGKHYQRALKGDKCPAPSCKARLFERCFGADGKVIATRCLGVGSQKGHVLVEPEQNG